MTRLARAFLRTAEENLAATERLLPHLARPAAYHLQQAAVKLCKALLAAEGILPVPRSHDIGYLAGLLPPGHPLAAAAVGLADLAQFHAAGYPLGDELVPAPEPGSLARRAAAVADLLAEARAG